MSGKPKHTSFKWDSLELERMVKIACLDQDISINSYVLKALKTQLEKEGYIKN